MFDDLHEGPKSTHSSAALRKYHANCFSGDGITCIHLSISIINHSCSGNAAITGGDGDDDQIEVFAEKPIVAGEGILIRYSSKLYDMLPRRHRHIV